VVRRAKVTFKRAANIFRGGRENRPEDASQAGLAQVLQSLPPMRADKKNESHANYETDRSRRASSALDGAWTAVSRYRLIIAMRAH